MKAKKNLKGMTLIEVIIAMAVFAMLGVVLINIGTSVDKTTRATNDFKKKLVAETPYAAGYLKSYYVKNANNEYVIDGGTGLPTSKDIDKSNIDITVHVDMNNITVVKWVDESDHSKGTNSTTVSQPEVTLEGDLYDTSRTFYGDKVDDADFAAKQDASANGNLNLRYIQDIKQKTTP